MFGKLCAVVAFVAVAVVNGSNCANILGIFPFPSQSHHILGHALLKGLAKSGHNVTMFSAFPVEEVIANYTHLYVKSVNEFKEKNLDEATSVNSSIVTMISSLSKLDVLVDLTFESDEFRLLRSPDSKFDLIILFYAMNEVFLPLAHLHDVPVVAFHPIGGIVVTNNLFGNPSPYAYVPSVWLNFTDDMNFLQRVANTVAQLLFIAVYNFYLLPKQKVLAQKYFPGSPDIEELVDRVDLLLVNSHISTESPRPYVPNVIQIGGFHIQDSDPLPDDLRKYLDEAEEGVIYFSFGTNVKSSTLPEEILNAFVRKFEKVPHKILWKYENDAFPYEANNIRTSKWLPQKAILGHKNVKAFISHGGMGGISEALYHGVPVVCIPFFGDQKKNCAEVVSSGVGVLLPIADISESTFSQAVDEILNNPTYSKTVQLRSALYKDQPINPLKHAIFWINHVLKHKGAKHLKNKATSLAWHQYFLLDVIAFLVGIVAIVLGVVYFCTKRLLRKIFGSSKKTNKVKVN